MANSTVTVALQMAFLDPTSGVTPADTLPYGPTGFQGPAHQYNKGLANVPTTAGGIAIPLGDVTSPGDMMIINRDSVNFITIMTAVSGTPFARIDPGKTFFVPLDPTLTSPAWQADTSPCIASVMVAQRGDLSPAP